MYELEKAAYGLRFDSDVRRRELDNGLVMVSSERIDEIAFDSDSDLRIDTSDMYDSRPNRMSLIAVELSPYLAANEVLSEEEQEYVAFLLAEYEVLESRAEMIAHAQEFNEHADKSQMLSKEDFIMALELSFALKLDGYKEADENAPVDDIMYEEALLLAEKIAENIDGPLTVNRLNRLADDLEKSVEALHRREEVERHTHFALIA